VPNEGVQSRILAIGDAKSVLPAHGFDPNAVDSLPGIILPPFFDIHFHWVQDAVRTMPKDSLLEWLRLYTFPTEAHFADAEFAEEEAKRFWKRILATGTIGGCCYSSIHPGALDAAMRHAAPDFLIGNVLMTMHSPPELTQTEVEAITLVERLASQYGQRYIASPRFAPTTGPEVMRAAALAAETVQTFIQTHLAENTAEIAWVTEMYRAYPEFSDIETYTDIYARVGLLGPRTIMGHSIHLADTEWRQLAETGTMIASCPTSNAPHEQLGLESGLFDFRRADAEGVRWALASDIGGGPFLSMLDVMQSFVAQNAAAGIAEATRVRALFRSTLAGAQCLGKAATHGNFEPGRGLHYIQIPLEPSPTEETAEAVLEAILAPHQLRREAYDGVIERTVLHGETIFAR
jgi:guanine deaminase